MKDIFYNQDGSSFHIENAANKFRTQEWILELLAKRIEKFIAKGLRCKSSELNYYVNVCEVDPPLSTCQQKHRDVWYGEMRLLDFFRKAQKDNPGVWVSVWATHKDEVVDDKDSEWIGNTFWIADGYTPSVENYASTDVSGLIGYIWKNALHLDEMTVDQNRSPWGPGIDESLIITPEGKKSKPPKKDKKQKRKKSKK
jgi:hypothetical protein